MDLAALFSLHQAGRPALRVISRFNDGAGPFGVARRSKHAQYTVARQQLQATRAILPVNIALSPGLMSCIPRVTLAVSDFPDSSV